MVYRFIIQISHAFSYAHANNLTHGAFDLTQALVDGTLSQYKVVNFRPWLAYSKNLELLKHCQSAYFKNLTKEQRMKIAKSGDLFAFGHALYDLMLNKITVEE